MLLCSSETSFRSIRQPETFRRGDTDTLEPRHGGTFPLAWTRPFGQGKVFVTLLGHNGLSFETPEFQKMVLNGVNWATS